MNRKEISKLIEENDIKWIQIHFTDVMGKLRILHASSEEFLENILKNGINFDGSSVGFSRVEKSDLIAVPDKDTFIILPHEKNEARVIANIYNADGSPFPLDPRYVLTKTIKKMKREGFDEIKISPEMEFYSFHRQEEKYEMNEKNGYFIPPPFDAAKEYRKELAEALIKSGYPVRYHHHEVGRMQQEIEVKALDAIQAADFCIYFKYLAREIASRQDMIVTFMPKPFSNDAGNGMHAHVALYSNGKNIFYDENNEYNLSQTAIHFIGGIIEHARAITAIANPTINSYKRLMPNFEAPCYIAWGRYNRSSLIRIPAKKTIDIEIRSADPSANPYLFYSAVMHAGIDGIKKRIEYEPIEENLYKIDEKKLKKYAIKRLPSTLMEAIDGLDNDDVIKRGIGEEIIEIFIEEKRKEWEKYMGKIGEIDYEFYFNV